MSTSEPTYLVLGGVSKVGRRVASQLQQAGLPTRVASRSQTDTVFDWSDPGTYQPALSDAQRVFCVLPANSAPFAGHIVEFLELARSSGVEHVTYLSARHVELAPPEVTLRAGELNLEAQDSLSYSILRPAWFMQNFTEGFLLPGVVERDQVVAPSGDGAEAFISADDIAAVAVATLTESERHAGSAYTLTGAAGLSFAETAEIIADTTGRPISHIDIDPDEWQASILGIGVPEQHAVMLGSLFAAIRSGAGRTPTAAVSDILGHEPIDFRDFARQSKDAWRSARPDGV